MSPKIWIVCPCFLDSQAFCRVREEVICALEQANLPLRPQFVLIDDTAGQDQAIRQLRFDDVQIVTPPYNLGHQGALVFALRGLGSVVHEDDLVVTMDSDGEDRPGDLPALIAPVLQSAGHPIGLAVRSKRSESWLFKISYLGFKTVFRVLVGTVIRNGNFAAYRGWLLKDVIFHPHFDQCYSSAFISLPLQIQRVPLPRGERYAGRSRMGFLGLVTHGIRMLMPFSEKIATRGIVASTFWLGVSLAWVLLETVQGAATLLPFSLLFLSTLVLGFSVILFATFSQNKARSLRGLNVLRGATR